MKRRTFLAALSTAASAPIASGCIGGAAQEPDDGGESTGAGPAAKSTATSHPDADLTIANELRMRATASVSIAEPDGATVLSETVRVDPDGKRVFSDPVPAPGRYRVEVGTEDAPVEPVGFHTWRVDRGGDADALRAVLTETGASFETGG